MEDSVRDLVDQQGCCVRLRMTKLIPKKDNWKKGQAAGNLSFESSEGKTLSAVSEISTPEDSPAYPTSIHQFDPAVCLGFLATFHESVLADGAISGNAKHVLASFVSLSNNSNFCTRAHLLYAKSQGSEFNELQDALNTKNPFVLSDRKLARVAKWCMAAQIRGVPSMSGKPPFTPEERPEILGTSFVLNYFTRVVDIFVTKNASLPTVPARSRLRTWITQKIKNFKGSQITTKDFASVDYRPSPGDPVNFMENFPDSPMLPKDFGWVGKNKKIAKAFAYWASAMDEMATKYIPTNVQNFVGRFISGYFNGAEVEMSKCWAYLVADKMEGTQAEKFSAVFMLLVAFDQREIDACMVQKLEECYPDSNTVKALGMWAAFQTAKTIVSWQNMKCTMN